MSGGSIKKSSTVPHAGTQEEETMWARSQLIDMENGHHAFGGDWTDTKLAVLRNYLSAYTTALKDKPRPNFRFQKVYIDAFAGTGYRTPSRRMQMETPA